MCFLYFFRRGKLIRATGHHLISGDDCHVVDADKAQHMAHIALGKIDITARQRAA